MAQKEALIQNFISELISFLPASTIDEKNVYKSDFYSLKVPLCILVLIDLSNMSNYEILKILLGGWHHCLPHSHIAFICIVLNFHTPFTTNGVDFFYVVDNE